MNASQLLIVRRRHAGNFTQIPNSLIRKRTPQSESTGVIVHLLSLPPGYRISLEGLCAARKEGRRPMRTAIQQLESLNYMRIVRDRSASGGSFNPDGLSVMSRLWTGLHTLKTLVWKSQFWISQFRAIRGYKHWV